MNEIINILKEKFKIKEFKEKQIEIINNILNGQDCIAILPTGYGKSIIYQALSFLLDGITIVISPLIALMNDQGRGLEEKNISCAIFNSSISYQKQVELLKEVLNGNIKIIYVSPEKLLNEKFKKIIMNIKVSLLVLDETHTILWKDSFRKSYNYIGDLINSFNSKPTILALTATATTSTINVISKELRMKEFKFIKETCLKKNIYYQVFNIHDKDKFLINYFKQYKEKILVYCLTRKKVEELGDKYKSMGFNVGIYHGGLEENIKNENQNKYTKDEYKIMFCTNAFGMGIDISNIYHVIHYEIPQSIEDLVQQAGRAARAGGKAIETILFNFNDVNVIRNFLVSLEKNIRKREEKKLNTLIDFCLSNKCRQVLLGQYFDETIKECGNCDNCKKKSIIRSLKHKIF